MDGGTGLFYSRFCTPASLCCVRMTDTQYTQLLSITGLVVMVSSVGLSLSRGFLPGMTLPAFSSEVKAVAPPASGLKVELCQVKWWR